MMKCASFFAGVGGIDLGFENAGFKTIWANEFDNYAASTFEANFDIKVDRRDIRLIEANEIPNFDILLAGFPCQAFSVAGYRKGFEDEKGRGNLFFELIRVMKEKKPRVAFFENVKNLVGHDNGNTFRVICEALDSLGYKYVSQVLNADQFGNVPQNRERIYIVAFKDERDKNNFVMPPSIALTRTIRDIVGFDEVVPEKYYYKPEKCCFYDKLSSSMKNKNTIYQWRRKYVRENKSNVVPTLTANMGEGGHNVPIILTDDGRIRKLTPRECFNTQGYPPSFKLPEQADSRLYKQAGNSVTVPVINRIAINIMKAIVSTDGESENIFIPFPKKKAINLIREMEERSKDRPSELFVEFCNSLRRQVGQEEKELQEKII